jgi:hypothetical protein
MRTSSAKRVLEKNIGDNIARIQSADLLRDALFHVTLHLQEGIHCRICDASFLDGKILYTLTAVFDISFIS